MSDLDPDRFALRQADAARQGYAQLMEELDLVKGLLARLPTRHVTSRPGLLLHQDEVVGRVAGRLSAR